ncbi:MAG TPA: RNA polymerase sigma-70 factor [Xylanibacter oryzae]|nr:RNA polymerase sigma-70 factor [Xylanibacter oryzae]
MGYKEINIEAILQWNDNSIAMLYDNFYQALVSYSIHITTDLIASEDIVQEVFSKIWENKIPFANLSLMKSYLYNSVRNMSINYIRHNKVENNILSHTDDIEKFNISANGEEDFFSEEIYRQLIIMINKLPRRQREIFLMCMDGKKNKEIAQALDISIETVKTHKKRAIKYLKNSLGSKSTLLLLLLIP